jgi:spermidine/putrescine transport system substrate-binding protein
MHDMPANEWCQKRREVAMTGKTRRNFLQMSGAFALAYAAAGQGVRPSLAAREKELNIYCWEGYNSDDVLDPFRKEFDAKVRAEGLTSDPDAINRLRAGETKVWDLINVPAARPLRAVLREDAAGLPAAL